MAEDLAGLFVALGLVALVCDGLWAVVSLVLFPWKHRPGLWTNRGDGMPCFRTFEPGRITTHRDGSVTVEEVETTYLRRRSTGGVTPKSGRGGAGGTEAPVSVLFGSGKKVF